jgi:hypothetical protein
MKQLRGRYLIVAFLALLSCAHSRAQNPTTEFFPELDAHVGLNFNVRLIFQDKQTLDTSGLVRTELGPSIEFYWKPIHILKDVTLFDLDETKPVPLALSVGYRVLAYTNSPTVNRLEPVGMIHLPFWGRILLSDKNRADMDWSSGAFYWRYRNRLTAERRFTIHSYHPGPYLSAEFFHTSKYEKWSNTRLYAGCLFPIAKHLDFDSYYEHENNTGPHPNQQINAAGFILNLYFPKNKK